MNTTKTENMKRLLRAVLPDGVPKLTNAEIAYVAGLTDEDLQRLAFPEPTRSLAQRIESRSAGWLATTKQMGDVLFVATPRSARAQESILAEIPHAHAEEALRVLSGGEHVPWYEFLRALPPGGLLGYYPDEKSATDALLKCYGSNASLRKVIEAVHLQAEIVKSSAEALIGLAGHLLQVSPVQGQLELDSLIDLNCRRGGTLNVENRQRSLTASAPRREETVGALPEGGQSFPDSDESDIGALFSAD